MKKLNKIKLSILLFLIMVLIIPGYVNAGVVISPTVSSVISTSCSEKCNYNYSEIDDKTTCYLEAKLCSDEKAYDTCNSACQNIKDDYCDSRFNEVLKAQFDAVMGYEGATVKDINAEATITLIVNRYEKAVHDFGLQKGTIKLQKFESLYDEGSNFLPDDKDSSCILSYNKAQIRRKLYVIAKAYDFTFSSYQFDQISGCETIKDLYSVIEKYYNIIKALAIAALIIFSLFDFAKVVVSGKVDEDMKKAFSRFSTRIVIACAILILPTLIQFILNISINYNILGGSLSDYWCDFAVIMVNYIK